MMKKILTLLNVLFLTTTFFVGAQTLDEVTTNGNVTTNSQGIRFMNDNVTPSAGVYNSILFGQTGASTQYLRMLPYSTFDGSYNWGTQFSYDIINDKWFVQGDVEFLSAMTISSGNVGIGTAQPISKFEIQQNGAGLQIPLSIKNLNGSNGDVTGIRFKSNASDVDEKYKAGIFFERVTSQGRGSMHFALNNSNGPENATMSDSRLTILRDGNVGVGTTSPSEKLHVEGMGYFSGGAYFHYGVGGIKIDAVTSAQENGYIRSSLLSSRDGDLEWDNTNKEWVLGSGAHNDFTGIIHRNGGKLSFYTGEKAAFTALDNAAFEEQFERLTITNAGNIGIGTTNPSEKLEVAGTVYSQEVKVEVAAGTGPDYVFEPDYDLRTLEDTEEYIVKNKHLPEVPPAKEMEANGVQLGEMNMLLLKKIEELTLYQIELLREVKQLKETTTLQQIEIEKLKAGTK